MRRIEQRKNECYACSLASMTRVLAPRLLRKTRCCFLENDNLVACGGPYAAPEYVIIASRACILKISVKSTMETIEESLDEESQMKGFSKASRREAPGGKDAIDLSDGGESTEGTIPLDTRPVHTRTAMGDYIVPKGGKPLTQQAFPTPGPGDYLPSHQLTQVAAPQYSIVGHSKTGAKKQAPGPGDYNTSRDLVWRDKRITLKGKGKTMITEAEEPTKTTGQAHNVRYLNIGKHAPKISISSRHREGVSVGHPGNALLGTVTKGLPTPGPNAYSPKTTDKGPFKSFGILHRHGRSVQESTLGPGPAAYNVKEPSTKSAGYSLAKRLRADWQVSTTSPAPNSYNVRSKIGKGLAMSIRSRQPYEPKTFGPSPNSYFFRDSMKYSDAPSAIVTYRPFESDLEFMTPSPTRYTITDKNRRKAPSYSFRNNCKYPVTNPVPENTPGPGTYLRHRTFTNNDAPAYSMGKRTKPVSSSVVHGPGPNHYHIRVLHRPDGKRAPSFTMAGRCDRPDKRDDDPAPTAYSPKTDIASGPKYSITSRHRGKARSDGPAPNSHTIKMNQTVRGRFSGPKATLKGRNTPFVYQGYAFQKSVLLRDS